MRDSPSENTQISNSKRWITLALIDLLSEEDLDSISVTALCKRAGVGRQTFYRHFSSLSDVLIKELNRNFAVFMSKVRQAYRDNPAPGLIELMAFEYWYKNELILVLVKHPACRELLADGIAATRALVERRFDLFDQEEPYLLKYRIGGLMSVFFSWVENGMVESPEHMAKILREAYRY